MDSNTLDSLLAWIGQNPLLAGVVIFLIAFIDALLLVGFAAPSLPLLFGIGTLAGLGLINPWYAMACAAAGAFLGDALSYAFGRYQGRHLRRIWPFNRHPQWLARGEAFFHRHGLKGIVIARYVGAVRPLVPAIAGMLHMRWRSYLPPSAFAAPTWAFAFIAPGWLFGAWLDLLGVVAGRLAVVAGLLLVLLGLLSLAIFALYRVLAPRAAFLVERVLAWSHRHPVLGRYSSALIDPKRPESPSLALLAIGLFGAAWAFFSLLALQLAAAEPSSLDQRVHAAFLALRTPLADGPMAMLSVLGDWPVLGPAFVATFVWLLWRRRIAAATHWLIAVAVALAMVHGLGALLHVPRPPEALLASGFSFPSVPVAMSTVVYGFFAILIARELPGRRRGWPYVVAGLLVACVAFSRLYLGAHWFSDVLGGALLGLAWITGLGIAYRRRVVRSFWVRPAALVFFLTAALSAAWFGPRQLDATLARFDPPLQRQDASMAGWWRGDWTAPVEAARGLPAVRRPLNLEFAGDPRALSTALTAAGWQPLEQAGIEGLLRALAYDADPDNLPILPVARDGRAETLLMAAPGDEADARRVLRLWPLPWSLEPGATPLWVGSVQTMRFKPHLDLVSFWEGEADGDEALDAVAEALQAAGLPLQRTRADDGTPRLRVRQP